MLLPNQTGLAGVEPATHGFGDRRSTNWSYRPMSSQDLKNRLLLRLFVWCAFTAKSTKFLQFQAFRILFFIFGAVVIDAIALSALKMNCLAHIYS
jgi:hypothetical protein